MSDTTTAVTSTVTVATGPATPLTPAHVSALQRFHDIFFAALEDLKSVFDFAAAEASQATALADIAEAATGNPELIPLTNEAAVGLVAADKAVNSTTATALIANASALVADVKTTIATAKGAPAAAASAS